MCSRCTRRSCSGTSKRPARHCGRRCRRSTRRSKRSGCRRSSRRRWSCGRPSRSATDNGLTRKHPLPLLVSGAVGAPTRRFAMRMVTRISAAFALLALLGAAAARAQHPQTRQGFWIGFGFGFGSLGLSCDGCSSIDRESGVSGFLKMGGTVSDKLLLGGESNGWTKDIAGTRVTAGNLSFTAYYYPAPANGLFLRGGLGFASYQEQGESGAVGFGLTF